MQRDPGPQWQQGKLQKVRVRVMYERDSVFEVMASPPTWLAKHVAVAQRPSPHAGKVGFRLEQQLVSRPFRHKYDAQCKAWNCQSAIFSLMAAVMLQEQIIVRHSPCQSLSQSRRNMTHLAGPQCGGQGCRMTAPTPSSLPGRQQLGCS